MTKDTDKSVYAEEICIMSLKLIKLTKAYEEQLGEMIDEWRADQELNHTNRSPWAIFKNDYHDFEYYLEHLEVKEASNE